MKYLMLIFLSSLLGAEVLTPNRSMLSYFDLWMESPDQKNFIYFEFDNKQTNKKYYPGKVIIKEVKTNKLIKIFPTHGHTHYGARQMWLTNQLIAYQDIKTGESTIVNFATNTKTIIDGEVEMPSRDGAKLLVKKQTSLPSREKPFNEVHLYNIESKTFTQKLTIDNVLKTPICQRHLDLCKNRATLKHPKFSPDGNKVLVVLLAQSKKQKVKFKKLLIWDLISNSLKEYGDIGTHPMWFDNNSVFSIVKINKDNARRNIEFIKLDQNKVEILHEKLLVAHAVFNPTSPHLLLSDVYDYPKQGEYSIILNDTKLKKERVLATHKMPSSTSKKDQVDGHPVWSREGKKIFYNCFDEFRKICRLDLN